jgi:hypothetical protein
LRPTFAIYATKSALFAAVGINGLSWATMVVNGLESAAIGFEAL